MERACKYLFPCWRIADWSFLLPLLAVLQGAFLIWEEQDRLLPLPRSFRRCHCTCPVTHRRNCDHDSGLCMLFVMDVTWFLSRASSSSLIDFGCVGVHTQVPMEARECGLPGAGVTDGCELPTVVLGPEHKPVEEQQGLNHCTALPSQLQLSGYQ